MGRFDKLLIAAAALALAGVAGCGPQRPAGPPMKLIIADASQPAFALLYIAEARGFLEDAGLDVTFRPYRLGRDALTSVIDGEADLATVFETPFITRLYEGKPLGVLSTLHTSTQNTVLVARKDRGISAAADLKGKRIGATRGTSTEYFLSVLLTTETIAANSVQRADIEPAAFEAALLGGEVDALVLFEPFQSRIVRTLGERATVIRSDAYIELSMLVGMREAMAAKPQAMARLAAALVKAQGFAEAQPEESIRIVAARLAGATEEAQVRADWNKFKHEASLNHVLVSSLQLEAQWLRDTGRFSGPLPDIAEAMVPGPLRAARPEAVTLPPRRTAGK